MTSRLSFGLIIQVLHDAITQRRSHSVLTQLEFPVKGTGCIPHLLIYYCLFYFATELPVLSCVNILAVQLSYCFVLSSIFGVLSPIWHCLYDARKIPTKGG